MKSSLIVVSLFLLAVFRTFSSIDLFLASCLRYTQEPKVIDDLSISKARGFKESKPHLYLKQDFVLATVDECVEARRKAGSNWLSYSLMTCFLTSGCISCFFLSEFQSMNDSGHDSIDLISHTNNLSKEYFCISLGNHHIWAPKPFLSAESVCTTPPYYGWSASWEKVLPARISYCKVDSSCIPQLLFPIMAYRDAEHIRNVVIK